MQNVSYGHIWIILSTSALVGGNISIRSIRFYNLVLLLIVVYSPAVRPFFG